MNIRFAYHRARLRLLRPALLLVPGIVCALLLAACEEDPPQDGPAGRDTTAQPPPKKIDTAGLPAFSGRNAYDYVAKQVAFGPRNPNSPGAKKALAFFVEELKKYADNVQTQEFTHEGYNGEKLNLTNVIASFNPNAGTRVLLCAHWDTRPRAEHDPDSKKHSEPILGANDGGSGVGVLLELARIFKENPPPIGVDIVLFDGEDYGDSRLDQTKQYFLGARYFSSNLPPDYKPAFGILLDLVGDIDAEFAQEANSLRYAAGVVNLVWKSAAEIGARRFAHRPGEAIQDDHLMLNEIAGIPTIDIIDIPLVGGDPNSPRRQYWHTHKDNMSNIGGETLEEVGRVLVYTLYRTAPAAMNVNATAGR